MFKHRKLIAIILLLGFWGLLGWAPSDKALVGKKVKYWLKGELFLENRLSYPQDIELYFPNLKTDLPYQRVEKLSFAFQGEKQKSPDGKWLIFKFPRVAPGAKAGIDFNALVELRDVSFPLRAQGVKTADLAQYLDDEGNIQATHPEIKKKAESLTRGISNPYYKALALYDYVRENLDFDLKKEPATASEVLRSKDAQCADAAYLYISLCRAQGIPARVVSGVHFKPGESSVDITHGWAEIYLEPYGWLPVDPTLGRYPFYRLLGFGEVRDGYLILNREVQVCFQFRGARVNGENAKLHWKIKIERQDIEESSPPRDFTLSEKQKANYTAYDFAPFLKKATAREKAGKLGEYLAGLTRLIEQGGARPGDYYAAAYSAYRLRKYESGMEYVKDLEEQGICHPELYYLKGRLAFDSKQFPVAEDALVRAVNLEPANLRYGQALADLLTLESSWEELRYYCAWADQHTPNPFFTGQQGYAFAQMGKFRQAAPFFEKAGKAEPQTGWYKAAQGWCLLESGDKIRGRNLIREGLKTGGGFEDRRFFERMLKD